MKAPARFRFAFAHFRAVCKKFSPKINELMAFYGTQGAVARETLRLTRCYCGWQVGGTNRLEVGVPSLPYNDRSAKGALPIGGKRTRYSVVGAPGLQLVVSPGNPEPSRRWYVRYQVGHGRTARRRGNDPIGDIKHWSLAQAWDKAREIIRNAEIGVDPKDEREAAEAAVVVAQAEAVKDQRTLEVVYLEWLAWRGRTKTLRQPSLDAYSWQFRHFKKIGLDTIPIAELSKEVIQNALDAILAAIIDPDEAKPGYRRGYKRGYMATKCLALIRSIFLHAAKRDYISGDPTFGIDLPVPKKNPVGRRHRAPTDLELKQLWNAASKHMSPQHVRMMQLAFLLGKRVSELCGTLQSEIDLSSDQPNWIIPGEREGNKSRERQVVPLPPLAVAIFSEQLASASGSKFAFPARGLPGKSTTRHAPSQAFAACRDTLGIDKSVRFHDARSLISDQMAKIGVPSEYRSHILHHTGDMRATMANSTYSSFDYAPQKRRALELWERRLIAIVEGQKLPSEGW